VTPYLYGTKQGTDIFDLEKTSDLLIAAAKAAEDAGAKGAAILFVGTKEESSPLVKAAAERVNMPHVTNRWIGGMLTNFQEIKKRIARLKELAEQRESGELERKYTKKERVMLGRELDKLTFNFGGIAAMERMPGFLLVIDPRHEAIAVAEARELGIPVIAVSSSDGDISKATYPIVANDTLRGSVSFILEELVGAFEEGAKRQGTESAAPSKEKNGTGA
jgi:small subunit ribosomal protein S2